MSSPNDTNAVAAEIGKQAFLEFHAGQAPEQAYQDYLNYRASQKKIEVSPVVSEALGALFIEFPA